MTYSNTTDEMQTLREWLLREREARGLSMRDLAIKLDKPHTYVHKVERGERRLDVVEYIWYCKALELKPSDGLDLIEAYQVSQRLGRKRW